MWRWHNVSFIVLILLAGFADPEKTDADKKEIERLEGVWHSGSDVEQIASILADDFVRPMPDGRLWTKADQIKWLRERPAPSGIRNRFDKLDVRIYNDSALAVGAASLVNGKGKVLDRTVFMDFYVKRDGHWQLTAGHRSQISGKR